MQDLIKHLYELLIDRRWEKSFSPEQVEQRQTASFGRVLTPRAAKELEAKFIERNYP